MVGSTFYFYRKIRFYKINVIIELTLNQNDFYCNWNKLIVG
ncbi:hypothetical protein LEP1GSC080_0661 [Leptospira interrogans str. FPW2026]|nr:hypothetical protein LEP1GSC080_0661 [Leptospira interrogans str. FPW2026]